MSVSAARRARLEERIARLLARAELGEAELALMPLARALADEEVGAIEVIAETVGARLAETRLTRAEARAALAIVVDALAEERFGGEEAAMAARALAAAAGVGLGAGFAAFEQRASLEAERGEARAALARVREGAIVVDEAGRLRWMSEPARAALPSTMLRALEEEGLAGLERVAPARWRALARAAIAGRAGEARIALEGGARELAVRATPLGDGQALLLVEDRTAARAEEREREERVAELAALHARLLRLGRERSLGELAGRTALAINNELNTLMLELSLVEREQPGAALERAHAAVRRAAEAVRRLDEVAARRPPEPSRPIDVDDLVEHALAMVRPDLSTEIGRAAIFDVRAGGVGAALAAPRELEALLCNLLVLYRANAVSTVAVRSRRAGLAIEVSLRGRLMAEAGAIDEELAADRELARRAGATLLVSRRDDGTLTARIQLVAAPAMAAAPEMAATPPPPTEVAARVPVIEGPAPTPMPAPAARPAPAPDAARRVLVVDDDEGNREVLAEVLRGAGFCVDTAGSAEEAMASLARGAPRAALVDLAMPGVSGLELAAALHRRAPEVHVAIVTGLDAARDPTQLPLAASFVERVFSKPIDLRALLTYLDAAAPTASP